MLHFSMILFPITSAARCVAKAPYVAAPADGFGSRVLTRHVAETSAASDMLEVGRVCRIVGAERTPHLNGAVDPVETIGDAARLDEADVIVMPARGLSRIRRLWKPSITSAVLAKVPCPVIMCPDEESESWTKPEIGTVVCATVRERNGRICGSRATKPEVAIAQVADQFSADLVVIGRSTTAGLLGRDHMRCCGIARQVPCPVAIVSGRSYTKQRESSVPRLRGQYDD